MRVTSLLGADATSRNSLPHNLRPRAPPDPPFYRHALWLWIVLSVLEDMLQAVQLMKRREREKRRLTGPVEKLHDLLLLVVLFPPLELVAVEQRRWTHY